MSFYFDGYEFDELIFEQTGLFVERKRDNKRYLNHGYKTCISEIPSRIRYNKERYHTIICNDSNDYDNYISEHFFEQIKDYTEKFGMKGVFVHIAKRNKLVKSALQIILNLIDHLLTLGFELLPSSKDIELDYQKFMNDEIELNQILNKEDAGFWFVYFTPKASYSYLIGELVPIEEVLQKGFSIHVTNESEYLDANHFYSKAKRVKKYLNHSECENIRNYEYKNKERLDFYSYVLKNNGYIKYIVETEKEKKIEIELCKPDYNK